jgi:hypothetical protein
MRIAVRRLSNFAIRFTSTLDGIRCICLLLQLLFNLSYPVRPLMIPACRHSYHLHQHFWEFPNLFFVGRTRDCRIVIVSWIQFFALVIFCLARQTIATNSCHKKYVPLLISNSRTKKQIHPDILLVLVVNIQLRKTSSMIKGLLSGSPFSAYRQFSKSQCYKGYKIPHGLKKLPS